MRTTPRRFFDFFVVPNYDDFIEEPNDVRRGFNACVAASQMADHYWKFCEKNDPAVLAKWANKKALLEELSQREPLFHTVRSVANIYKHLYDSGGSYDLGSPAAVSGVVLNGTEVASVWRENEQEVVIVHRRDGSEVVLSSAVAAVVRLWNAFLPEE